MKIWIIKFVFGLVYIVLFAPFYVYFRMQKKISAHNKNNTAWVDRQKPEDDLQSLKRMS